MRVRGYAPRAEQQPPAAASTAAAAAATAAAADAAGHHRAALSGASACLTEADDALELERRRAVHGRRGASAVRHIAQG